MLRTLLFKKNPIRTGRSIIPVGISTSLRLRTLNCLSTTATYVSRREQSTESKSDLKGSPPRIQNNCFTSFLWGIFYVIVAIKVAEGVSDMRRNKYLKEESKKEKKLKLIKEGLSGDEKSSEDIWNALLVKGLNPFEADIMLKKILREIGEDNTSLSCRINASNITFNQLKNFEIITDTFSQNAFYHFISEEKTSTEALYSVKLTLKYGEFKEEALNLIKTDSEFKQKLSKCYTFPECDLEYKNQSYDNKEYSQYISRKFNARSEEKRIELEHPFSEKQYFLTIGNSIEDKLPLNIWSDLKHFGSFCNLNASTINKLNIAYIIAKMTGNKNIFDLLGKNWNSTFTPFSRNHGFILLYFSLVKKMKIDSAEIKKLATMPEELIKKNISEIVAGCKEKSAANPNISECLVELIENTNKKENEDSNALLKRNNR